MSAKRTPLAKREWWLVAACALAALLLGAATRLAVNCRYKPAAWMAIAAMVVFGIGLAVMGIRQERSGPCRRPPSSADRSRAEGKS